MPRGRHPSPYTWRKLKELFPYKSAHFVLAKNGLLAGKQGRSWNRKEFEQICQLLTEVLSQNSGPKMGADPEFEIIDSQKRNKVASEFFSTNFRARLGVDANVSTGELRPKPGSPYEVVKSIGKYLQRAANKLPDGLEIVGGSGVNVPLGGHIHVEDENHIPPQELLGKLDQFISIPLNSKSNEPKRYPYGRLSEYRHQSHGWEYRTPCSWLAHPILAMGVLTIARALIKASREGKLASIQSQDDLFAYMGLLAKTAKDFYNLLGKTERIEAIQVFRAWGIKKRQRKNSSIGGNRQVSGQRNTRGCVQISNDRYMRNIFAHQRFYASVSITIEGASEIRNSSDQIVYLPLNFPSLSLLLSGVRVEVWDRHHIGLSIRLRERLASNQEDCRSFLVELDGYIRGVNNV